MRDPTGRRSMPVPVDVVVRAGAVRTVGGSRVAFTLGMAALVARPLQGLAVVVVSDHGDLLDLLFTLLQMCGARVHGYASAQRALAAIVHAAVTPDVVLLDSATEDISKELLLDLADGGRLPIVAFTIREEDGPRSVWWLKPFNAPHLHSTEANVVCTTLQSATLSR